jgi:hypothetical protein
MGVFERVYSLLKNAPNNPREDYLTEIFGEVINDKNIMSDFADKFLHIKGVDISGLRVETQKTYKKLENHETDSRPDLVIEFYNKLDKNNHIIIIESKLGASEGDKQLQRYAEHLDNKNKDNTKVYLVYITQKHDPKDKVIFNGLITQDKFYQYRWYQIYNWLKTFKDDRLNQCLLEYMEERGMDKERIFLPQDVYVIQNLVRILNMLEETISDEVQNELSKFGKLYQGNRLLGLMNDGIYRKCVNLDNRLEIGVELHLTEEVYPIVRAAFWVSENYSDYENVRNAVDDYVKQNKGTTVDTDTWPGWIGLCIDKPFVEFMAEKDHIKALQDYYIEGLKNIKGFMDLHLEFQWNLSVEKN